jgi:hypothetical protein
LFIWFPVVSSRSSHKAEVHEVFPATFWETFGGFVDWLLSSISLFFEINVAKWVPFKFGWHASDAQWQMV